MQVGRVLRYERSAFCSLKIGVLFSKYSVLCTVNESVCKL